VLLLTGAPMTRLRWMSSARFAGPASERAKAAGYRPSIELAPKNAHIRSMNTLGRQKKYLVVSASLLTLS
jgi:hypothetical protein